MWPFCLQAITIVKWLVLIRRKSAQGHSLSLSLSLSGPGQSLSPFFNCSSQGPVEQNIEKLNCRTELKWLNWKKVLRPVLKQVVGSISFFSVIWNVICWMKMLWSGGSDVATVHTARCLVTTYCLRKAGLVAGLPSERYWVRSLSDHC